MGLCSCGAGIGERVTDRRCAQALAGDYARASLIDSQRSQRLLYAALNADSEAADVVSAEIGNCPDCLRGVIIFLVNALCTSLVQRAGGDRELTLTMIAKVLAEALDADDDPPDPPDRA